MTYFYVAMQQRFFVHLSTVQYRMVTMLAKELQAIKRAEAKAPRQLTTKGGVWRRNIHKDVMNQYRQIVAVRQSPFEFFSITFFLSPLNAGEY
jgi:hypothetical protein